MKKLYAAYGLRLWSSFELQGMKPATGDLQPLPTLTLSLLDPASLEDAWSGSSGPPEWRGRQGDGRDLTIEQGSAGDLLFGYGDLARFRLDTNMRHLDCVPSARGLDWQRILISKVIPSISVMLGYEGLHAAAIESPDGVLAIMAPSGSGKSTLALEFLRRGWPLFADDILTLALTTHGVRANPGTPHMNIAQDLPAGLNPPPTTGKVLDVVGSELWVTTDNRTTERREVHTLCLLERREGLALELQTLPPNPLLLAPYMLGLSATPERQRSRFLLYADLTESAALVRLSAGLEHSPRELATVLEHTLRQEPTMIPEATR